MTKPVDETKLITIQRSYLAFFDTIYLIIPDPGVLR